ncbi:multidrug effflux MFS transporter [Granulosicoccaceae sp. 1_MG-2023]|nr:multidrug effflux MFS transporter [Granulosicoccaceae sp. 1_MG-2023]
MSASQTGIDATADAPLMSARRVSLLGGLLIAMGPISMAMYTPAMPAIVEAFGSTEAAVKLTLTLYFAGFACAQLIAGPLSDALGRKPVTVAFLLIYLLGSVLALLAPTVETLMLGRFVQGVGASVGIAVSRALVRDLFTGHTSAKIMNVIGIILALGPALAPTIGGVLMEFYGWRSSFVAMFLVGVGSIAAVSVFMRETVGRDLSRLQPASLLRSYGLLLTNRHFLLTVTVISGAVGALYAQSTFLPFILMNRVGLTPSQFGLGMLMQSGCFFLGALMARQLMRRISAYQLVTPGLCLIALGSAGVFMLNFWAPTYLRVMGPVAPYALGIAFVMPAMSTAALAPFRENAGAASALMGFLQMGSGLLFGTIGALMGDPVSAMANLVPVMGLAACLAYIVYRRHPHLAEEEPRHDVLAAAPPGRTLMPDKENP